MSLYSFQHQWPSQIPNRIRLPNGTTKTDSDTFTPEELSLAGWVEVDYPPSVEYPNKLVWNGTEWEIREPNEMEIESQWQVIRNTCERRLFETDYLVIKAYENGIPVDPETISYRQTLRDIYNDINNIDPWFVEWPVLNKNEE
jgi:hypothetical protein